MNDITLDKEGRFYLVNGRRLPRLSSVLDAVGFAETYGDEYAMDRGSKVHRATELWDKKTLDMASLDPILAPYLSGWQQFLEDSQFKTHLIEYRCWSDLGFGCTLDRVGQFNETALDILDIKTGTKMQRHRLQTAGQTLAFTDDVLRKQKAHPLYALALQPKPKFIGRWTLHLNARGTYKLQEHRDYLDLDAMRSAISLFNWRQD